MLKEQNIITEFFSLSDGGVLPDSAWIAKTELEETVKQICETLGKDLDVARRRLEYIFSEDCDVALSTRKTSALVKDWYSGKDLFSSTAMMICVLDNFGFTREENYVKKPVIAMLVASVLAEVQNNMPYHNNQHFRKVLLHVIRMIAAHNNRIFKNNRSRQLSHADIAKLLIGACIHDIGHKGKGNIINHEYFLAMIEKRSFGFAYPFLQKAGVSDEMLSDIRIMVMTTDVSPIGDPISPANQLHAAYGYHFGMDNDEVYEEHEETVPSDELAVLYENSHLCFLCMMLHEADIMNSVGLDYDITRNESVCVGKEIGLTHYLPEDTLFFLKTICKGKLRSDAARYLAENNMEAITMRVINDYNNGNKSYQ